MSTDTTHGLMKAMAEELATWAAQHGCTCGHPACTRCQDTKEARALVERYNALMGSNGRRDHFRNVARKALSDKGD